jgi:hypothetical protein
VRQKAISVHPRHEVVYDATDKLMRWKWNRAVSPATGGDGVDPKLRTRKSGTSDGPWATDVRPPTLSGDDVLGVTVMW